MDGMIAGDGSKEDFPGWIVHAALKFYFFVCFGGAGVQAGLDLGNHEIMSHEVMN